MHHITFVVVIISLSLFLYDIYPSSQHGLYYSTHTAVVVAVVVIIIVAVVVVVIVVVRAWLMHASQEVWRLDRCLAVPSYCR